MPNRSTQPVRSLPLGFSLVELLMTIAIIAALASVLAPALARSRAQARGTSSSANLMIIGAARDMYAKDSNDLIFTYTWRGGETYIMPDGRTKNPASDADASAYQNQEILQRRTGRINGVSKIQSFTFRVPHRRFVHLVLMDYMAGDDDASFPDPVFVDPAHGDLLNWRERPLDYLEEGSGLPYAGFVEINGYDEDSNWSNTAMLQRWPYASSYLSTPFAWQGDGPDNIYGPIESTPNLFQANGTPDLSGRSTSQVAFPSQKVHLFEEYDREQKRYPYFAYDQARPDKLMFDGSINDRPSGEASSSYNPTQPNGDPWTQRYVPIHVFPIPLEGLGKSENHNMRYMWTRYGLQGTDYTP